MNTPEDNAALYLRYDTRCFKLVTTADGDRVNCSGFPYRWHLVELRGWLVGVPACNSHYDASVRFTDRLQA